MVKILIDLGADVDAKSKDGWTPLLQAAWMGIYENDAKKMQQMNQNTLIFFFRLGRDETMKLLIQSGADVNAKKDDGSTALHFVAESG